jgi:uncharacterized membrane protein
MAEPDVSNPGTSRYWPAFLLGAGLMGELDAIAFHHLLRWHNLYVHGGEEWRSLSDGVLHLAITAMLLSGFVMASRFRGRVGDALSGTFLAGTTILGMGAFQLLDGILFHKVLGLHPVREGAENILLYDAAWLAFAILLLLVGSILRRQARRL